jgi:hypothetical protein
MKYWFGRSGYKTSSGNYTSNTVPGTNNGLSARGRHWINIDGRADSHDTDGTNRIRNGDVNGNTITNGAAGTSNFPRVNIAGEWSAIDVMNSSTDNRPVIAYYDADNQTVRLAVAATRNNPQPADWKVQYAMNTTDPNFRFSGQYVSMIIDQANNDAHLAFFKSNSTDLIYLKLHWTGSIYEPYSPSVIVDDVGAVGRWVDITLSRDKLPQISYLDITRTNFYDGVKMAYYDPAKFTEEVLDQNGVSQKGWETMHVPARFKIQENRTSIETWPSRDTSSGAARPANLFWDTAIGYANDDFFRIAYYLKPKN